MAFKRPTKQVKSISVAFQNLWNWSVLNILILILSITLNFTYSKSRIANLNEHMLMHSCVNVEFLKIGMSNCFLKLIFKTLQYFHMKVLSNERISKWAFYVTSITGSKDISILSSWNRQFFRKKFPLWNFKNWRQKSLISVFSKFISRLILQYPMTDLIKVIC